MDYSEKRICPYRIKRISFGPRIKRITSDVFDGEEVVALFGEDGTANVELDPIRSGSRREFDSMAERYREEVKYKVISKYAVN